MTAEPVTITASEPKPTEGKKEARTDQITPSGALVGLNEASRLTGRGKETILKYAADGKLSVVLNGQGKKCYQVVDLERVFGFKKSPTSQEASNENHNEPEGKSPQTALEVVRLQGEIATLQATIQAAKEKERILVEVAEDAKQNAENWRQQAERATLILTDQRKAEPPAAPPQATQPEPQVQPVPEPKRGILGRIFGGGKG